MPTKTESKRPNSCYLQKDKRKSIKKSPQTNPNIDMLTKTKMKKQGDIHYLNCANFDTKRLNNLNKELNYQDSLVKTEKDAIYLNGLSLNQWKSITKFSIVGQSNKKKRNFNIAIDHYFNLKSMYKKINTIKNKPSLYSQKSDTGKKIGNDKKLLSTFVPQKMVIDQIQPRAERYYKNPQFEEIEVLPEKKKSKIKPKKFKSPEKTLKKDNDAKNKNALKKTKKKQKKLNKSKKKKIKPNRENELNDGEEVKKEEDKNNEIIENNKKFLEKKSVENSEFENESELEENEHKSLIKSKSSKKDVKKITDYSEKKEQQKNKILTELSAQKNIKETSENDFEDDDSEIEEDFEQKDNSDKNVKEQNINNFDITKIAKEIPKLVNFTNENDIEDFKEKLVKLIFEFEIFEEDEFINFYELVCQKNQHIEQEKIEEIFNDVKSFLYEQFKMVGSDCEDEDEDDIDEEN